MTANISLNLPKFSCRYDFEHEHPCLSLLGGSVVLGLVHIGDGCRLTGRCIAQWIHPPGPSDLDYVAYAHTPNPSQHFMRGIVLLVPILGYIIVRVYDALGSGKKYVPYQMVAKSYLENTTTKDTPPMHESLITLLSEDPNLRLGHLEYPEQFFGRMDAIDVAILSYQHYGSVPKLLEARIKAYFALKASKYAMQVSSFKQIADGRNDGGGGTILAALTGFHSHTNSLHPANELAAKATRHAERLRQMNQEDLANTFSLIAERCGTVNSG